MGKSFKPQVRCRPFSETISDVQVASSPRARARMCVRTCARAGRVASVGATLFPPPECPGLVPGRRASLSGQSRLRRPTGVGRAARSSGGAARTCGFQGSGGFRSDVVPVMSTHVPATPPHTHTGQSASRGCPEAGEERGAGREGDTHGHLTGRKRIIKTDSGTDPGARHVQRVCDTAVARPLPVPMSLRAAALRQTARRLARGKHRAALGTGTDTSSVTGNFWPVVCVSDAGSR